MTGRPLSQGEGRARLRIFRSSGEVWKELEVRPGLNLWYLLRRASLPIGSSCTGVGVCGACAVGLQERPDSETGHLESPTPFEKSTRAQNGIPENLRIACLVRVFGDLDVTLRP